MHRGRPAIVKVRRRPRPAFPAPRARPAIARARGVATTLLIGLLCAYAAAGAVDRVGPASRTPRAGPAAAASGPVGASPATRRRRHSARAAAGVRRRARRHDRRVTRAQRHARTRAARDTDRSIASVNVSPRASGTPPSARKGR
jgi:hypothetical protein